MYPVLFLIQFIIDRTFLNRKRMTHGNQFRCFFHAHDSSHPRHAKDIAFFDISLRNACHDFRTYRNISGCQCSPISNILSGNIHQCVKPFSMALSSWNLTQIIFAACLILRQTVICNINYLQYTHKPYCFASIIQKQIPRVRFHDTQGIRLSVTVILFTPIIQILSYI